MEIPPNEEPMATLKNTIPKKVEFMAKTSIARSLSQDSIPELMIY